MYEMYGTMSQQPGKGRHLRYVDVSLSVNEGLATLFLAEAYYHRDHLDEDINDVRVNLLSYLHRPLLYFR